MDREYSAAAAAVVAYSDHLHNYELIHDQISMQVPKPDKETSDKQMRQKPYTCSFIY